MPALASGAKPVKVEAPQAGQRVPLVRVLLTASGGCLAGRLVGCPIGHWACWVPSRALTRGLLLEGKGV